MLGLGLCHTHSADRPKCISARERNTYAETGQLLASLVSRRREPGQREVALVWVAPLPAPCGNRSRRSQKVCRFLLEVVQEVGPSAVTLASQPYAVQYSAHVFETEASPRRNSACVCGFFGGMTANVSAKQTYPISFAGRVWTDVAPDSTPRPRKLHKPFQNGTKLTKSTPHHV